MAGIGFLIGGALINALVHNYSYQIMQRLTLNQKRYF